ncbi:hypothetical protein KFE25_014054 [Diacronema lutheri]|uniref:Uncharacterized protein n=1 Tax=Diacronema lutheri TaxID=2081491 RepID=A0A8J6C9X3_DIALT|nr:hypothetical protein KFE25_014054 [Diacronema lutheri]
MNGELRATFVDADEARMLRAMRRYTGDDAARAAGNRFSQANGQRIAALAERNASRPAPQPAPPAPPARRGLEPKASSRAIPVPKVGRVGASRHYAPIDFVQPRRRQPERPDYSAYEPPQLAPYAPPAETREAKKERLQDRLAYGDAPAAHAFAPRVPPAGTQARVKPSEVQQVAALTTSISTEIDERREFLAEMGALGKAAQYEAQIRAEIAVRQQELKRLQALMRAADGGGAVGAADGRDVASPEPEVDDGSQPQAA